MMARLRQTPPVERPDRDPGVRAAARRRSNYYAILRASRIVKELAPIMLEKGPLTVRRNGLWAVEREQEN
jgi:hypothetical protein